MSNSNQIVKVVRIEIPVETYEKLAEKAKRENRSVRGQAAHILTKALE